MSPIKMFKLGVILIISIISAVVSETCSPKVTTPLGQIEGRIKETVKGRNFFAFEGVPYARPPVGKYRFDEPQPLEPWTGIWKANTIYKCIQYNHMTQPGQDMVVGDEDCLYINIYTPNLNPTEKMDVLIFIHGGAFMFNYGAMYGPEIIMDRDVVYISINYRLGPLGFLSTEDDVVPGNNGLKDQIMALKWIKENIHYFGGNPDSVTISGMSAGGASVHLHYLLPESKGLFHKGISQSGTSFNAWVLVENPLEKTKKLSSLLGCSTIDSKQMVECLKNKPGRQITYAVQHFQPWLYNPFSPFALVVDSWASKPVLPEHPYKLLKSKQVRDVPWITSYTSSEGLYPAYDFYYTNILEELDVNWNQILPHILHYNETLHPSEIETISQKIREHFLQGEKLSKEFNFQLLVKLISERLFIYDIEKTGRLHSAVVESPVYSYYFNYRGAHSKSELRANTTENIGVAHGDDTSYIFHSIMNTQTTEDDRLMCEIMTDIFTSFMRTGKPTTPVEWKPLSKNPSDPWVQLHIAGPHDIHIEEKDQLTSRDFWDSIPFRENDRLLTVKDEL